ncbi:MAG: hypothetical protein OXN25_03780 [Candidatus Poribacteria bacterium]|nr:hypothetical protein [Candidatus Poribacteria bacterium]
MLSKMTFTLVFVLVLAFVAGPAFAQEMTFSPNLNSPVISENGFHVAMKNVTDTTPADDVLDTTGIIADDSGQITAGKAIVRHVSNLPDINALFAFGGTVELLLRKSAKDAAKADVDLGNITTGSMYRLAITEIMWGIDAAATDPTVAQWIEVYNEGAALKSTDDLRLLFTTNKRVERDEVTLVGDSGLPTTGAEAEAGAANSVTFTVVDRVSVINRFGVRWDPPGQSGRTSASTDGKHPVKNLVSMYRKRSTNADKTAYTAHDANSKAGEHRFGDGTDSSQWVASVGRINMAGPFIGTPGMPQQDDDGIATQSKAPASLPGTSVIINEIYNSDTLQWIELHNTGSAAQEVKKWTLHAAYEDADGNRQQQRVFSIPDEGTSIPGGGFLVITNRDPADSVLAGYGSP